MQNSNVNAIMRIIFMVTLVVAIAGCEIAKTGEAKKGDSEASTNDDTDDMTGRAREDAGGKE